MKSNEICIAATLAFVLTCEGAMSSELVAQPGKLQWLFRDSAVIATAFFQGEESSDNEPMRANLRFRTAITLCGNPKVETIVVPVFVKSIAYRKLRGAKKVLFFLKEDKDDALLLTDPQSYIVLEGDNVNFAEEFQEYLEITRNRYKSEEGRKAFREFAIKKAATSKSEYLRQNMAEELWLLVKSVPLHGFTEEDIVTITKAAIGETSFSVAEPLCLILDKLGSDKTDDCIFHALTESSVNRTSTQLADVIAKRENLVKRLLAKTEDMKDVKDSSRLFLILNHLYRVPDAKLIPALRILAQRNPAAHRTIKSILGNWDGECERTTLRREIEEEEKKKSGSKPAAAHQPVDADFPPKSTGNEENHEVQGQEEGK